jgi:hypothetical protein
VSGKLVSSLYYPLRSIPLSNEEIAVLLDEAYNVTQVSCEREATSVRKAAPV